MYIVLYRRTHGTDYWKLVFAKDQDELDKEIRHTAMFFTDITHYIAVPVPVIKLSDWKDFAALLERR